MEEPTAEQAGLYMEICAALMTHFGVTEVQILKEDVPMREFQIMRRVENGILHVRLAWDEKPTTN